MLKIRDHILNEFVGSHKQIIELGASTIPSSYVLPEVLSAFGQLNRIFIFILNYLTAWALSIRLKTAALILDWWE